MNIRRTITPIFWALSIASAFSQAPRLDYTLGIRDASRHQFKITISASDVTTKTLDVAMPAWTPGWYVIKPYAGNVSHLRASFQGKPLPIRSINSQTWQITTLGHENFQIEYDYYAENRSVNGAELTSQGAFFVGTSLFLYVPGHTTDVPTTIRLDIPNTWKVATPLAPSASLGTYSARNFDELVDSPTVMGNFDTYSFTNLGKQLHLIVDPRGSMTKSYADELVAQVQKIVTVQARLFGGLPYPEYWLFFLSGPSSAFNGLEHENSTTITVKRVPSDIMDAISIASHEMFHAWNVKRLKPKALIPYDYNKEQTVRELWFAEGFTSYYGELNMRRAGITSPAQYLNGLAGKIQTQAAADPDKWVSLSDSSAITWLGYDGTNPGFTTFSADYYNKGEVVALLMDMKIRAATANAKSLDDVMRSLYETKLTSGYTNADIEATAAQISGTSFADFFAKYVDGTADLNFDVALKIVGLRYQNGQILDIPQVTPQQRAWRKSWLDGL